ncbi:hotdog fold thioesterase [Parasedimentitalea maritima]|uniref:Hotdog fold thioesterase n=1 Tax=Parasedimentitalea maritima TaxID=2578117 RepID=A0A6A4RFB3_9RHOB|nr:hotdog fold thioesterase [Zongyanglinia marina]
MPTITWSSLLTSAPPDPFREINDPGCQQLVGYRTQMDTRAGSCEVTLDLQPQHLNRIGVLHGGIVATLLDVVCGNTASAFFDRESHPNLVTVSLNISYVAAARSGPVIATAKATGGGRSIAYVNGELRDEEGALLATATGIFKRVRG